MPWARPRNKGRDGALSRSTAHLVRFENGTWDDQASSGSPRLASLACGNQVPWYGEKEEETPAWIPASYTWMAAPDTCAQLLLPRTSTPGSTDLGRPWRGHGGAEAG